ncbi:MAG: glycosyltransferase family 4 protein [Anaerolineales bacterium]
MRIGLLHYSGPPTVGGVEQTLYHHSRALTRLGHYTRLIVGQGQPYDQRIPVEVISELYSKHPAVLAVKAELDRGRCRDRFNALRTVIETQLQAAIEGLDVLIVHNAMTLHKNLALTAALWNLHTSKKAPPLVGWHHDFAWDREEYQEELKDEFPWDLLRKPWPGATNVVVSRAQRARLAKLYALDPADIRVIPPGIDPSVIGSWTDMTRRIVAEYDLLQADAVLLLPARITHRKNIELALQVLAELRSISSQDVRLIVTGPPGPHNPANATYLDQLLSQRRTLELTACAHFLYERHSRSEPRVDRATMANLYALSDALLFPSLQEGFGIPLLQAGFTRLPIYCSDIEPFHESVEDGAHFFSLQDSPKSVAKLIADTLLTSATFLLRRDVRRKYPWEIIVSSSMIPMLESVRDGR